MKTKKTLTKALCGLLVAGLLVGGGTSVVMAEDSSKDTSQKSLIGKVFRMQKSPAKGLEAQIEKLVEEGKITQEQSDKLDAFFEAKKAEKEAEREKVKAMSAEERKAYFEEKRANGERPDLCNELVEAGILSAEEAAELVKLLPARDGERRPDAPRLEAQIEKLVEEGKITQEQSDKLDAFFEAKKAEKETEREKVKAMSAEERKAYFEEKRANGERPDLCNELVEAGILSAEEAAELVKLLPAKDRENRSEGPRLETQIEKLVEEGKITQEQSDKLDGFFEAKKAELETEREKVKAMSAEERKAYFEEKRANGERPDLFNELVEAGILSAEEAAELKSELPEREKPDFPEQGKMNKKLGMRGFRK